jgi:hypothetical protein
LLSCLAASVFFFFKSYTYFCAHVPPFLPQTQRRSRVNPLLSRTANKITIRHLRRDAMAVVT